MIVVIGAGLCGLAAARTLHESGRRVVVLEGRDRAGGRAWTDASLGAPVDLGASWIHGVRGNPISDLATRATVGRVPTDHEAFAVFDGRRWLDASRLDRARQDLFRRLDEVGRRARAADRDASLRDAIDRLSSADVDVTALHDRRIHERVLSLMMGADLETLSTRWWDQDEELPGGDALLREGYGPLVRTLAEGLDVRLGHVVERVARRDGAARVSGPWGAMEADAVVVTLPLGVLKRGAVTFDPPLPDEKRRAIERVGVGVLDKVVLRFSERRWRHGATYLGPSTPVGDEPWAFLDLAELGWPPMVVAFASGAHARRLEARTDAEVTAIAARGFARLVDGPPPELTGALVTRWDRDPFARGAYSHLPPGASAEDLDALAAPVDGTLFFGGEHTHRQHPATAHGAYLSGLREARRILDR